MKKSFFLLFGMASFFLQGCKNSGDLPVQDVENNSSISSIPNTETGVLAGATGVALNNGSKWEANPETTNGIAIMQGLVGAIAAEPTVEDYRALHKKLTASFQSILKQCTMKGEAHNQLHNYLLPLKDQIDTLGSESLDNCRKNVPELNAYLMKYSQYFE